MSYSPGPWKWSDSGDVLEDDARSLLDANGEPVLSPGTGGFACESDPYGSYPIIEGNEADAQLIAAAPEMLTALVELLAASNEPYGSSRYPDAAEKARAAIAKAEGNT